MHDPATGDIHPAAVFVAVPGASSYYSCRRRGCSRPSPGAKPTKRSTPKMRWVLWRLYGGFTVNEIADQLEISPNTPVAQDTVRSNPGNCFQVMASEQDWRCHPGWAPSKDSLEPRGGPESTLRIGPVLAAPCERISPIGGQISAFAR